MPSLVATTSTSTRTMFLRTHPARRQTPSGRKVCGRKKNMRVPRRVIAYPQRSLPACCPPRNDDLGVKGGFPPFFCCLNLIFLVTQKSSFKERRRKKKERRRIMPSQGPLRLPLQACTIFVRTHSAWTNNAKFSGHYVRQHTHNVREHALSLDQNPVQGFLSIKCLFLFCFNFNFHPSPTSNPGVKNYREVYIK